MNIDSPILILLAAGDSSRMGFPKGLLDYHGKPWILEQISRYQSVNKPKIIIVLGNDIQNYFEHINWFPKALNTFYDFNGINIKILHNKNTELGAFSSLKWALSHTDKNSTILVQPIDVPLLENKNLATLIKVNKTIVIPNCNAKNGHPVKLKPLFWNQLLNVNTIAKNARLDFLIKESNLKDIYYLNVNDELIYSNMNTLNDWNAFVAK